MLLPEMISDIRSMRPAVPAKDFAQSKRFYEIVGFRPTTLGPTLTEMRLGQHSFLLQDFYKPELAHNFVMHLLVGNIDEWWEHIRALALESIFDVRPPIAPKLESWGLNVMYLFDPSGVLWQIASRP